LSECREFRCAFGWIAQKLAELFRIIPTPVSDTFGFRRRFAPAFLMRDDAVRFSGKKLKIS
jgi:hypothetical protein